MAHLTEDNITQFEHILKQAYAFEEEGLLREARKNYEECISYDGGIIPKTDDARKQLFYAWLRYSIFLKNQKEWIKAFAAAQRANDLRISDYSYCIMGECYREIGEPVKAEKALNQAITIKPRTEYWVLLYVLLFNHFKGRSKEAVQCLYYALELDSNNEEALYFLGVYLGKEGDYKGAEKRLKKAISIDPRYGRAHAELAWVLYLDHSDDYNADGDFIHKIENRLLESIEFDPSYGGSRLYLAFLFEKQKRIRKANEQYKELLKIWPDRSISNWAYGSFLAQGGGNQKQAEYYLRKAVGIDPEDSVALYFLGKALMSWKRYSEANQYLLEAANRGHEFAQEIIGDFHEYVGGSLNFDPFNEKMFYKYGVF